MQNERPRIIYFRNSLPIPVCVAMSLFFAMVFQFNGGVFIPAAMQMASSMGKIQEDIMMAGYASFIGMTIIFPILFRLKSRFTTKNILMTVCPVLICCNLIMLHTDNLFLMIAVCFISGFFRMWGTFECFSNTRLTVTPSGNFSVFYPVIYIIVLESIQLSGLVTIHVSEWANWRYMHWFVIVMLMIVWILVYVFTKQIPIPKKLPLYGIDWLGGFLWLVMLFSIVFICIYGEYFDWFDSPLIRLCVVLAVISVLININRMVTKRRPYVSPEVFRYKDFPIILFLFLMLCLFLTTSSVLQTILLSSILKFDSLNSISLNWYVFAGILAGAGIVFYRQVVLRKAYTFLIILGFTFIVIYQYYMYFLIYPDLNIEALYIPNFIKGIGHGVLYISLTIYIAKTVPFKHFFQALCVLSFIRTSIATPLGTALLTRAMKYFQQSNIGNLSRNINGLGNVDVMNSMYSLYMEVNRQTMLTSLKELFGWICIFGTVFLVVIYNYHFWKK